MPQHTGIVATLVGPHPSVFIVVKAGAVVSVGAEVVLDGCVICTVAAVELARSSASE